MVLEKSVDYDTRLFLFHVTAMCGLVRLSTVFLWSCMAFCGLFILFLWAVLWCLIWQTIDLIGLLLSYIVVVDPNSFNLALDTVPSANQNKLMPKPPLPKEVRTNFLGEQLLLWTNWKPRKLEWSCRSLVQIVLYSAGDPLIKFRECRVP